MHVQKPAARPHTWLLGRLVGHGSRLVVSWISWATSWSKTLKGPGALAQLHGDWRWGLMAALPRPRRAAQGHNERGGRVGAGGPGEPGTESRATRRQGHQGTTRARAPNQGPPRARAPPGPPNAPPILLLAISWFSRSTIQPPTTHSWCSHLETVLHAPILHLHCNTNVWSVMSDGRMSEILWIYSLIVVLIVPRYEVWCDREDVFGSDPWLLVRKVWFFRHNLGYRGAES